MIRPFRGTLGRCLLLLLVSALVAGGLAWVSYTSLEVETAQRAAAAQADRMSSERLALWRLDGKVLPVISSENSRAYEHFTALYTPPEMNPGNPLSNLNFNNTTINNFGINNVKFLSPLASADLEPWVVLHVQLEPDAGWFSPQVMPKELADQLREEPYFYDLKNVTDASRSRLAELNKTFPAKDALRQLKELEKSNSAGDTGTPVTITAARFNETERLKSVDLAKSQDSLNVVPNNNNKDYFSRETQLNRMEMDKAGAARSDTPAPSPISQNPTGRGGSNSNSGPGLPQGQGEGGGGGGRGGYSQLAPAAGSQGRAGSDNDLQSAEKTLRDQTTKQALERSRSGSTQAVIVPTPEMKKEQEKNSEGGKDGAPAPKPTGAVTAPQGGAPPAGARGSPGPGGPPPAPAGPGGSGNPSPAMPAPEKNEPTKPSAPAPYGSSTGGRPGAPLPVDGNAIPTPTPGFGGGGGFGGGFTGGIGGLPAPKIAGVQDNKEKKQPDITEKGNPKPSAEITPKKDNKDEGDRRALDRNTGALKSEDTTKRKAAEGDFEAIKKSEDNRKLRSGPLPVGVHLGTIRPVWLKGNDGQEQLFLIRTARLADKTVYQGALIDWPQLKDTLKDNVSDLFPEASLHTWQPNEEAQNERSMSALPVLFEPGPAPALPAAGWTPLRYGLALAWAAALIAIMAVWLGGWSLAALSEKRIRFVSAVTHELRTPLTSLRLYLDMLTSGMVKDEAKKTEYLNTLSTESDRLNRLIENVLDFARLERRGVPVKREATPASTLLEMVKDTWAERVAADGKELVCHATVPTEQAVNTDPRMALQILGNLIDNARKYTREASDPRIWVWAKPANKGWVAFEVEDRGPGVATPERRTIFRAFRRGNDADSVAGGVGLGLALAHQWTDLLGGKLSYKPAEGGTGACFRLELPAMKM